MKGSIHCKSSGFSLAEVTISIAIIATVLLPVIAMLAGGAGIIADSEDRFTASGVGSALVSQLKFSPEQEGFVVPSKKSGGISAPVRTVVPLPASGKSSAVYLGFDRDGFLARTLTKEIYKTGTPGEVDGILYLIKIEIEEDDDGYSRNVGAPPLYRANILVEAPAFTGEENRSRQELTTLLSGR